MHNKQYYILTINNLIRFQYGSAKKIVSWVVACLPVGVRSETQRLRDFVELRLRQTTGVTSLKCGKKL